MNFIIAMIVVCSVGLVACVVSLVLVLVQYHRVKYHPEQFDIDDGTLTIRLNKKESDN